MVEKVKKEWKVVENVVEKLKKQTWIDKMKLHSELVLVELCLTAFEVEFNF
jgi:hypothetical protein